MLFRALIRAELKPVFGCEQWVMALDAVGEGGAPLSCDPRQLSAAQSLEDRIVVERGIDKRRTFAQPLLESRPPRASVVCTPRLLWLGAFSVPVLAAQ